MSTKLKASNFAPNIELGGGTPADGSITPAMLSATGNRNSSTVLRGDGTWATYQAPLISGTNIKTVNGSSLIGSGGLTISSVTYSSYASGLKIGGTDISFPSFPPSTGEALVYNGSFYNSTTVVVELVAGSGVSISSGNGPGSYVISASGGGGGASGSFASWQWNNYNTIIFFFGDLTSGNDFATAVNAGVGSLTLTVKGFNGATGGNEWWDIPIVSAFTGPVDAGNGQYVVYIQNTDNPPSSYQQTDMSFATSVGTATDNTWSVA